MRLLTHNYLQSNVKGTDNGYPLSIDAVTVTMEESPLNRDLLVRLVPKLEYITIKAACQQLVSQCAGLPELPNELPAAFEEDETLLADLHKVLFDVHVLEGHLVCPGTGRKFPIKEGIPNMILHEDEL